MKKSQLRETIRSIVKKELTESEIFDRFTMQVESPNYSGTIKRNRDGWKLYDENGLPEEAGPFKEIKSLMSYFDININELSGEYVKMIKENNPATAPTKPQTQPTTKPGNPDKDRQPKRRPLGNPNVQPKPKASLKEEEFLNKIVDRFKNRKKLKENIKYPSDNKWQEGYKAGYSEGFTDCKLGKNNKFGK